MRNGAGLPGKVSGERRPKSVRRFQRRPAETPSLPATRRTSGRRGPADSWSVVNGRR
jgi:hypothetical protein